MMFALILIVFDKLLCKYKWTLCWKAVHAIVKYFLFFITDDHSRVKLTQLAEKDGKLTDYINANYVDVSMFQLKFYENYVKLWIYYTMVLYIE